MAFIKKVKVRMTTPIAKLHYPALFKPDTKFAEARKPDGEYKCGIVLDPNDAGTQALIAKMEKVRDDYRNERLANEDDKKKLRALKDYSLKPVFVKQIDDEGDDTGLIIINTKQAKTVISQKGVKHNFSVVVVDSKRNKITKAVWGGSEGKLSFDASGYDMSTDKAFGVSCALIGAQITVLKSGGNDADAADLFDEEEGFVVDPTEEGIDSVDNDDEGVDPDDF